MGTLDNDMSGRRGQHPLFFLGGWWSHWWLLTLSCAHVKKKKINGYLLKNRNTIYNSTSGDESQNEKKTDPIQDRDIEKRKQEMWW